MGTSVGDTPTLYGVEDGYSEDYGSHEGSKLHPTHDNIADGETKVVESANKQHPNVTPVNPFTQQVYEDKVTNPFAKK